MIMPPKYEFTMEAVNSITSLRMKYEMLWMTNPNPARVESLREQCRQECEALQKDLLSKNLIKLKEE
jgi:hypothetical protein